MSEQYIEDAQDFIMDNTFEVPFETKAFFGSLSQLNYFQKLVQVLYVVFSGGTVFTQERFNQVIEIVKSLDIEGKDPKILFLELVLDGALITEDNRTFMLNPELTLILAAANPPKVLD